MKIDYDAVLFDFSSTLFQVEDAHGALLAALGPDFTHWADELRRLGAINGSSTSDDLPEHLHAVWEDRDLSAASHRAAYSGLSVYAGLTQTQADALYDRGIDPAAWTIYPDTMETLSRLRDSGIALGLISNIGWDPRPVLAAGRVLELIDVLVLSDERGVVKPDPDIFRIACAELRVAPERCLMVGDNEEADGGARAIGMAFARVPAIKPAQRPDALLRAVGLVGGV
jgi:HAD superfamily hydrolase (TIGR01509 family)